MHSMAVSKIGAIFLIRSRYRHAMEKSVTILFGMVLLVAGPVCRAKKLESGTAPKSPINATVNISVASCHNASLKTENKALSLPLTPATDNVVSNSHDTAFSAGIPLDFVFPLYYGFMISAVDSGELRLWAANLARSALWMKESVGNQTEDLLVHQFLRTPDVELAYWKERNDVFHCTIYYNGYGEQPGVRDYARSDVVQRNLKKRHHLEISGLLATPRTISLRVKLNEEQLRLWNQEDRPTLPRGSRAHITVVTANGVPAVVAGSDTLTLGELMAMGRLTVSHNATMGKVHKHEDNLWYLALDKPKRVSALFTAFYSQKNSENSYP